ncbi:MAG: fatty acid desaturase [Pseudomonadota bacterium]
MDHTAFLKTLTPEAKARLTAKSDAAGLWHLAGHGGLIVALAGLVALKVPFWPLLLPVLGVALVFLFTLEHEATHQTPFRSEALNEWVGRACGVILIVPFQWFRYFHLAHHRFTNDPARDPELAEPKPETPAAWLWHVSGLPYWSSMIQQVAVNALGRAQADYLPARAQARIVTEARWMVAIYAVVLAGLVVSDLVVWVWLVPMLLGQPVLRLYLLAEHGRCPAVANMFENTRTTFTNRVVRFLAWNMPYHIEHHAYPAVPFHRLPELHRLAEAHLVTTAPGYVAFTKAYTGAFGEAEETLTRHQTRN